MRTAFTYNANHASHEKSGHFERPARLHRLLEVVQDDDIWETLVHVDPAPAELETTHLVHTPEYVRRVQDATRQGAHLDADTYTTPESLDVGLLALGGLLDVTQAVLSGDGDNGFAATRPPGHHATPNRAMGFCLFSTIAIAARWVQQQFGIERVLIVDVDVHHGNGTQDVFYDDPNVLYASVHQHPLYPGTGGVEETGTGRGEGATVNVPLPPQTGDAGYRQAFHRVLAPMVRRFRPEVIFVSAGYDAHWKDPLSNMHLSVDGFAHLVYQVMEWADACCDQRLIALLEGGYDIDALAYSVLATLHTLGDPTADITDPFGPPSAPEADVDDHLRDVAEFHQRAARAW